MHGEMYCVLIQLPIWSFTAYFVREMGELFILEFPGNPLFIDYLNR